MADDVYQRLKSKLVFDPLEIDQELIELPMIIMDAAEETAERLSARDRAKNALDLASAEASDELRRTDILDAKGNPKIRSEAQILTEVPLNKNVQGCLIELENAKYDLALWHSLIDALKAKRDAMKVYADLTISGYLSPSSALNNRRADIRNAGSGTRRRPI